VIQAQEAYRILRQNLMVAIADLERPTIVFTSARAGEGKTSTVVNLGRVMALAGQRVVVVDLDLRHPEIHSRFGLPNEQGVSEVLRGRAKLEDCLQYVAVSGPVEQADEADQHQRGLYVVTSGSVPPNPSELLGTRRTARLLEVLADQADIVLIDSAPVLPVADTLVIGRLAAGAVLVVEARRTPVPAVLQAKDALIGNQTRLLGVVVSKLQAQDNAGIEPGPGYYDIGGPQLV
jgi:capsular exopolysaccharide synthesis family protein